METSAAHADLNPSVAQPRKPCPAIPASELAQAERSTPACPPSSAALSRDPLHLHSQRALQLKDLSLPAPAGLFSFESPTKHLPPPPKKIVMVNPPLAELHSLFNEIATLLPA